MPNWSETIIKIFVRPEHAHFTKEIIASLATPGMDTSDLEVDPSDGSWLDLEALLPVPPGLMQAETMPEYAALVTRGNRSASAKGGEDASDEFRRAVALRDANIAAYGVDTAFDWQRNRWGTKWNATGAAPRVGPAGDHDAYCDFEGATMITYRITTPWSEPSGYLSVLRGQCELKNMGLRVWVSHEDGGSRWNPETEEYQTVWDEVPDYDLDMEDLASSEMMVIAAKGMRFEPSAIISEPIADQDPLERMLREHMQ